MPFLNRVGSGATSKFGFRMGFAPGAPTSVTASLPATYGNTTASVSWTAPVMVGSPALNDYIIQYSSDSGSSWTTFSDSVSATTSTTVTGLTNGFAYVFRVAAVNNIGTSPYSTASNSVTPLNSKIPTPLFVMDDDTQGRVGIDFSNFIGEADVAQSYEAFPGGKYFYNYFDCGGGLCPNDTFGTSQGWTGLAAETSRSAYLKVQRFGYADSDTVFCSETSPPAPTTAAPTAAPTTTVNPCAGCDPYGTPIGMNCIPGSPTYSLQDVIANGCCGETGINNYPYQAQCGYVAPTTAAPTTAAPTTAAPTTTTSGGCTVLYYNSGRKCYTGAGNCFQVDRRNANCTITQNVYCDGPAC